MSHRFSYVRYDGIATERQETIKEAFEHVEQLAETLTDGRAKSLLFTHLEIAYMWAGKSLRDDQIARNSQIEHVAERTNE